MADLPLRCQLDLWFQLSSCHFVVRHRKVSHRFPGDFQTPRFPSDWLHAFHRHWSQFHCRRTVRGEWDRSSRATINGSARRLTFNHARLTAIFWGCVLAVSLCHDVDAEVKPHRWICQCRAARVGCCAGEQSRFIGAVQSPVTCKQRNTRTHTDIRTDSNRYKTTRLNRGYYSVMQIDACLYFQMQVHICMSSRSHATSLTQPQPHHRASWHMKLPPHHPLWIITWQQILSCCCRSCATVHHVSSSNPAIKSLTRTGRSFKTDSKTQDFHTSRKVVIKWNCWHKHANMQKHNGLWVARRDLADWV